MAEAPLLQIKRKVSKKTADSKEKRRKEKG